MSAVPAPAHTRNVRETLAVALLILFSFPIGLYAFGFQLAGMGDPAFQARFATSPVMAAFHVIGGGFANTTGSPPPKTNPWYVANQATLERGQHVPGAFFNPTTGQLELGTLTDYAPASMLPINEDTRMHLMHNPDVLAAYKPDYGMTPDQYAQYHYQTYGAPKQRDGYGMTGPKPAGTTPPTA